MWIRCEVFAERFVELMLRELLPCPDTLASSGTGLKQKGTKSEHKVHGGIPIEVYVPAL